ncbi:MAG: hypothetical protein KY432_03340, partial [Acidobacteria bacterium]|nr:hypothetical protein [Acidobacteriota bacterium]
YGLLGPEAPLRIGARWRRLPLELQGEPVGEWTGTLGYGRRFGGRSSLDVAFEFGTRGALEENGLEDSTYVMSRYIPRAALWKTEYYAEFLRPMSVEYSVGMSFRMPDGGRVSISVYRGDHEGGDFTPEDVRRLEMLRPFLSQALRLRDLQEAAPDSRSTGSLESFRQPAILIMRDDSVRPLNDAGEEYLRHKRLSRRDRAELERVLRSDNASLFSGRVAQFGSEAGCVAIVSDEMERDPREQQLVAIFGLTSREAQVAVELLRGDPYSVVAERLGIGTETVRTFVRSIHRKSGISSTKRFIRLVEDLL